jgi:hypothetical protein
VYYSYSQHPISIVANVPSDDRKKDQLILLEMKLCDAQFQLYILTCQSLTVQASRREFFIILSTWLNDLVLVLFILIGLFVINSFFQQIIQIHNWQTIDPIQDIRKNEVIGSKEKNSKTPIYSNNHDILICIFKTEFN